MWVIRKWINNATTWPVFVCLFLLFSRRGNDDQFATEDSPAQQKNNMGPLELFLIFVRLLWSNRKEWFWCSRQQKRNVQPSRGPVLWSLLSLWLVSADCHLPAPRYTDAWRRCAVLWDDCVVQRVRWRNRTHAQLAHTNILRNDQWQPFSLAISAHFRQRCVFECRLTWKAENI